MATLINLNSDIPRDEERQLSNLSIVGFTSISLAFIVWSLSPFVTKNIYIRYTSLVSTIGLGCVAVGCGRKVQRLTPIVRALRFAREDSQINAIAASGIIDERYWEDCLYLPEPQAIALSPDTNCLTRETITTASIQPSTPPSVEPAKQEYPAWLYDLLASGVILIYGPKGSGKSSIMNWLIAENLEKGYKVIICNSHAAASDYESLEVYGRGRNFREIETGLETFLTEVDRRYQLLGSVKGYDPFNEPRLVLFCDEMTNWGDEIDQDLLSRFWLCAIADLRKANAGLFLISHGITNASLGGKALAGRNKAMLQMLTQLHCTSKPNPDKHGDYIPTGRGEFTFLGSTKQVQIPSWLRHDGKFSEADTPSPNPPEIIKENIYTLIHNAKAESQV